MASEREEACGLVADEMIANEPALVPPEDRQVVVRYLMQRCEIFLLNAANQIRADAATRLIRKRDAGVPWDASELEEAARYGVKS